VVWDVRQGADRYDMGAAGLLTLYLGGHLRVPMLGPPPDVPWFDPVRDRVELRFDLSEGDRPYPDRLRALRDALAPTADRRTHVDQLGRRQDAFKATDRDWLLMYDNAYGHQIRVSVPPGDERAARRAVKRAAGAMGCRVRKEYG